MGLVKWGSVIGILAVATLLIVLFLDARGISDDDVERKVRKEVAAAVDGLDTLPQPTSVPTTATKQFLTSEEIQVMVLREVEKALAGETASPVATPTPSLSLSIEQVEALIAKEVAALAPAATPTPSLSLSIEQVEALIAKEVAGLAPAATPTPSLSLSIEQVEALIAKEVAAAFAPTSTPTATATPPPTVGIRPVIWRVEPEISVGNALIVHLQVETNVATRLDIKYGNESSGWYEAPTSDKVLRVHERQLISLKADKEYQYLVTATGSDGQKSRAIRGTFITGTLPEDLAALQLEAEGTPTFRLVLADYTTDSSSGLLVTDGDGDIVWYMDWSGLSEDAIVGPVIQREDYSLVAIPHRVGLVEFSPSGEVGRKVLNSENGYFHHDLREAADGSLLTMADVTVEMDLTRLGLGESELVAVPAIRRVDFETGRDEAVWNALDHLDISEYNAQRFDPWSLTGNGRDWLHVNTLSIGIRGNYLLSSPNLSTIYSIDAITGEIQWRLGGEDSDFDFVDESDRFYFQHTSYELPNGNVLLFDNGGDDTLFVVRPEQYGKFSRGLELELDYETMTVRKVWEYRHRPDHVSATISSVQRLPSGHTLVNFGRKPVTLVEADEEGNMVWAMTDTSPSMGYQLRYRATAVDSISGEIPISPPGLSPIASE